MSELFLVRHAQARFGTGDYDRLSELGLQQSRWLGEYFGARGLAFDRVICGGMKRHRQTVDGIAGGMARSVEPPEVDNGWNEFSFQRIVEAYLAAHPGERPRDDRSTQAFSRVLRNAMLAWAEGRLDTDHPEAALPESWADFEQRVGAALQAVLQRSGRGQSVLVVSSGGAISMALRQVLGAPASAMVQMNLQLRNTGCSQLFFSDRSAHFAGFNHVPHLDRPDRAGSITYY